MGNISKKTTEELKVKLNEELKIKLKELTLPERSELVDQAVVFYFVGHGEAYLGFAEQIEEKPEHDISLEEIAADNKMAMLRRVISEWIDQVSQTAKDEKESETKLISENLPEEAAEIDNIFVKLASLDNSISQYQSDIDNLKMETREMLATLDITGER